MVFKERYEKGDTPWEIHRPDYNLIDMVLKTPIPPCHALDIGCGTGNNAIWLQQQKFDVIGIDSNKIAIETARAKARNVNVPCSFYQLDFFSGDLPGVPFDFAFDRGCFHHFRQAKKLDQFAERVYNILNKGGLWLTLAGNADETRKGPGPPQLRAAEIVNAVEPYFEIRLLKANYFDSNQEIPPKNWICLMKKRN